jgi:hypothetical protein
MIKNKIEKKIIQFSLRKSLYFFLIFTKYLDQDSLSTSAANSAKEKKNKRMLFTKNAE